MDKLFAQFATATAKAAGSPVAFLVCVASVVIWALCGPYFKYSETWQLVINTGTFNKYYIRRGTPYTGPMQEPDAAIMKKEALRAWVKRKIM